MNKVKLSLIAIATLVASNVNAQTYYSCIPEGCPAGQYFDGVKCLALPKLTACPSGKYFDGVNCLDLPTGGTGSSGAGCFYKYTTGGVTTVNGCPGPSSSAKGVKPTCNTTYYSGGCSHACEVYITDGDKINGKTCDNGNMK